MRLIRPRVRARRVTGRVSRPGRRSLWISRRRGGISGRWIPSGRVPDRRSLWISRRRPLGVAGRRNGGISGRRISRCARRVARDWSRVWMRRGAVGRGGRRIMAMVAMVARAESLAVRRRRGGGRVPEAAVAVRPVELPRIHCGKRFIFLSRASPSIQSKSLITQGGSDG
jgi:hypothetical protein